MLKKLFNLGISEDVIYQDLDALTRRIIRETKAWSDTALKPNPLAEAASNSVTPAAGTDCYAQPALPASGTMLPGSPHLES
jgi:hypothetical protein